MSKKSDIDKTKAFIKFLQCFIEDDLQPEDRNELLQDLEWHKSKLKLLRKASRTFASVHEMRTAHNQPQRFVDNPKTAGADSLKSSESEPKPAKASASAPEYSSR